MRARKFLILTSLPLTLAGCVNGTDASVNELTPGQKAEGFLMVTDIIADGASMDSFLVTCAGSDGKKVEEKRSRTEIEKNQICKPAVAAQQPAQKTEPSTATASVPTKGILVTLQQTKANESYIKRSANLNISADKSKYQLLLDYCIVPAEFVVDEVCKYSSTEYRVTQNTIQGCMITPGFIYSAHFKVNLSTVPACK